MKQQGLPKWFVEKCAKVKAKRPRTVIQHILKHGHVTTQELRDKYGYNHPPRAARDVKEQGIPLVAFRVVGSDGRKIVSYRFGDPKEARFSKAQGRTAFSKELKRALVVKRGCRCEIYLEEFPERELQIDHRVPFEIAGEGKGEEESPDDFMLLCGSANRAKSWSCEHCVNWVELKKPEMCRKCYWAYPDDCDHVAMRPVRRLDLVWMGEEVKIHDELKRRTEKLQKRMPSFVKEIIRQYVEK